MPELEFKEAEKDDLPVERVSTSSDVNPDNAAYKKVQEELEVGETKLKYSMRRKVAGFLTVCAGLIVSVYTLHLILPSSWRWLSPEQLDDIKDISLTVFGSLTMSIGALFFSKK